MLNIIYVRANEAESSIYGRRRLINSYIRESGDKMVFQLFAECKRNDRKHSKVKIQSGINYNESGSECSYDESGYRVPLLKLRRRIIITHDTCLKNEPHAGKFIRLRIRRDTLFHLKNSKWLLEHLTDCTLRSESETGKSFRGD